MSDADKPFIAYRQGRWGLKIVPRNGAGWWLFLLWMLPMVPIAGVFTWGMASEPEGGPLIAIIVAFVAATAGWILGMTRWMYVRSEVVQIEELLALKREKDAQKLRR
jgi:hypothetical protein